MSTEFTRMKNAAEDQKRKKMQGEARIQSLEEEEKRIYTTASQEANQTLAKKEDIADKIQQLTERVVSIMEEARKIFEEEGVTY